MSIIEQAARRLEQLRQSGVEVPSPSGARPSASPASPPATAALPLQPVRAPSAARARPALPQVPAPHSRHVRIDLDRLAAMGYLTPETPRAKMADEFRVIKRPLLQNVDAQVDSGQTGNANLIMVTSALPGEGKTFVSVNLAMSMAMELDRTVLLVDADVARPALLPRLGVTASRGLLDVLADPSIELSDVLLRTNIEKLTLLPPGTPRAQATELLASDEMDRLLADIASRYSDRIVVFDAPPLLPSTESRVLASKMGQVVFVVEAQKTAQKAVRQALATIETCPVVMPLLNKANQSDVGFYYGYGYGQAEG